MARKEQLLMAHLILGRTATLYEGGRDPTRTSVGLQVPEEDPSVTVTRKLKLPRAKIRVQGGATPKAPTAELGAPSEAPTGRLADPSAETKQLPGDATHFRQSAQKTAAYIRKTAKDPAQPAWKRKLVRSPFHLAGSPVYAAPEAYHQGGFEDEPMFKGRVKVTASDAKEREQQHKEAARTLANTFGRDVHTCRTRDNKLYTSTTPCSYAKGHELLHTTSPTRTQRAMRRATESAGSFGRRA